MHAEGMHVTGHLTWENSNLNLIQAVIQRAAVTIISRHLILDCFLHFLCHNTMIEETLPYNLVFVL